MAQAIIPALKAAMAKEPRELAGRLVRLIEQSPFSQVEISRRAGHEGDPGWTSRLLLSWTKEERRGKMPTIPTCWDLARGLGITLGELLGPDLLGGPPVVPIPEAPPKEPSLLEQERERLAKLFSGPPTPIPTPAEEPRKRGGR